MTADDRESSEMLRGMRVAFVGKLASMSRRDAARLVRGHGAVVVERVDAGVDMAVVGEEEVPLSAAGEEEWFDGWFDDDARGAIERGRLEIVPETQLWQRLGLVEPQQDVHRLYTSAMLAELLKVPVAVIRRWHRRGLIVPRREVRRLAYFDFQEVATARRLAELLAAGVSPAAIERKLAALARWLPSVERPLAQLSVIVRGREILLRQGDGLVEPGGQLRFDFEAWEEGPRAAVSDRIVSGGIIEAAARGAAAGGGEAESVPSRPEDLCRLAAELEEDGQLAAAAEMYRAAMAAGGPEAETCFLLAELLYRQDDLAGARERYYTAIELDEDYVEARANLGCVLGELGQRDLAIAAFEGALAFHGDYADAHYHLARALDEQGDRERAEQHWRTFLALAADSPWADEARARLGEAGVTG